MLVTQKSVQKVFAFVFLGFMVQSVWAENFSASEIMHKLSQAVKSQNYQGKFRYQYNGNSRVYEVAHAVIDGTEYERISYAGGRSDDMIQFGKQSDCDSFASGVFRTLAASDKDETLDLFYSVSIDGQVKIGNREAWKILLKSKDENRYNYELLVDKTSSLPLGTSVKNQAGDVLESIEFIELRTSRVFTKADFNISNSKSVSKIDQPCFDQSVVGRSNASMKPKWLPEGFVLTGHKPISDAIYQESYSDGMSTFSVFVEKLARPNYAGESDSITSAESFRGATFVLMTSIPKQDHMIYISIVGEIPPEIARKITLSMR